MSVGEVQNGRVKMLTASSALRVLDVDTIRVDSSYQRGIVNGHKRIVAEFDENALGVPLVAQREDGTVWVVDGLQRLTALKKLGKKTVRAEVFVSKGPEHEAAVFRLVNAGRTKLNPADLFRAKLTEGNADAWAIKGAVEAAGFRLAFSRPSKRNSPETAWKHVTGISTLERVYRMGKEPSADRITRILMVCGEAWPGDLFATNSDIVGGLGQFYADRGDEMVDDQRLVDRLRTTTPHKVIYSAGLGVGGRHTNVAAVVAKLYAKRATKKAPAA